jgi:hypothetical protein
MRRTHQALATLALGLALVGATTAAAAAATTPTGTQDPPGHVARTATSQSERERTLARHRALGEVGDIAAPPAIAAQPAVRTDPAAPDPGVDVPATLLVGLVGGLVGGAAVAVGWTAATRRRRPRTAAGT